MSDVFLSHVEEDAGIALRIALGLEERGFGTWCYELDNVAGASYLVQTARAIHQASAVIVVISPRTSRSLHQVRAEVVRAHEEGKRFIPILDGISHADFQGTPGLEEVRQALGASTSVRVPPEGVGGILDRIVVGLRALGLEPRRGANRDRITRLVAELAEDRPVASPSVAAPAERPRVRRGGRAVTIAAAAVVLSLAALFGWLAIPALQQQAKTQITENGRTTPTPAPVAVGVMDIRPLGDVPAWMCDFTRDGLNTVLSKIGGLRVYSKEKIDFLREKRNLSEIEAAETLGIQKMISGSVAIREHGLTLEARVVDIGTGVLEHSAQVSGREEQLVELQNGIALRLIERLHVSVDPKHIREILAERSNENLENYRLLTESMGVFEHAEDVAPPGSHGWNLRWLTVATAHAADDPEMSAVRAVIESYRVALEAEDLDRLSTIQVGMTAAQRDALGRYFQNAEELRVEFSELDVLLEGKDALATFMRRDVFRDARTGREVKLEVRVNSELSKQPDGWRILGLKKPS